MNQKLSLYKRIVIPNAVNGARVFFSARSRREGPCAVTASPNMLGPIRVFSVAYDGVSGEGYTNSKTALKSPIPFKQAVAAYLSLHSAERCDFRNPECFHLPISPTRSTPASCVMSSTSATN
jgi:hypothetical protein